MIQVFSVGLLHPKRGKPFASTRIAMALKPAATSTTKHFSRWAWWTENRRPMTKTTNRRRAARRRHPATRSPPASRRLPARKLAARKKSRRPGRRAPLPRLNEADIIGAQRTRTDRRIVVSRRLNNAGRQSAELAGVAKHSDRDGGYRNAMPPEEVEMKGDIEINPAEWVRRKRFECLPPR